MGTNAVGAMIVAGPEGFVKNQYRKFNIRDDAISPGDDLGMMREVLGRRFSRLVKEQGLPQEAESPMEGLPAWPDLVLIDGGAGQLSAAQAIFNELGLNDVVHIAGIAKGVDREAGRERILLPGRPPFTLPPRDPVLYFIQRLRDEAHRFAIGSHRARRKKGLTRNQLDEIDGIGPRRKQALLHHFGSAKAVSRAAIEDLRTVDGISEQIARLVHAHFHEKE